MDNNPNRFWDGQPLIYIPALLIVSVLMAVYLWQDPLRVAESREALRAKQEILRERRGLTEPVMFTPHVEQRRIMEVLDSAVMLDDVEIAEPVPISPFAGTRESFGRFCETSVYSGIDPSVYDSPGFADAWALRGELMAFREHVFSYPMHRTRTVDRDFVLNTYPPEIWDALSDYWDATDALLAAHPGLSFWDQEDTDAQRLLSGILLTQENENTWYVTSRLEHWIER